VGKEKTLHDERLTEFDKLLASYAAFQHLPHNSTDMWFVEQVLLNLIDEKNAHRRLPYNVLVALAGAAGELIGARICKIDRNYLSFDDVSTTLKRIRARMETIKRSARWLVSSSRPSWISFWRRRYNTYSLYTATDTLNHLLHDYFPIDPDDVA